MADAFPPKLKLHHHTPTWVPAGEVFHIRIRCDQSQRTDVALTTPALGSALLESAKSHHTRQRWWCRLFLLMPDHLHALIAFPKAEAMSRVIGEWKHYHTTHGHVSWQEGYFDHRIRSDAEFELKAHYIRQNPVVKNLCVRASDWPWFCEPACQS
jgi:REP element-mobilizing transposase RayT